MIGNALPSPAKPIIFGVISGAVVAGGILLGSNVIKSQKNPTGLTSVGGNLFCSPSVTTKASDFRTGLNGNYRENLALLLAASRRVSDSDPNATDVIKSLDDNAWDLGFFLENFYGKEVAREFTGLWQEQDKAFIDYTQAVRDHDQKAKILAEQEIQNHILHKTSFWKKQIPHLDVNRYQRLVLARADSIKSSIDAYARRDVAKSFKEQHTAYQQTGLVADMLSESLVQEQPYKFVK